MGISPASASASPTRRRRVRTTRRRVVWIDRITTGVIRGGGITVIAAVLGIMVYLTAVVWPLFGGAEIASRARYALDLPADTELLEARVDEYSVVGAWLTRTGEARLFEARTGRELARRSLFPADPPVSASARCGDGRIALGLSDGAVRLGRLGFSASFLPAETLDDSLRELSIGATAVRGEAVVQRTGPTEWRRMELAATGFEPIDFGAIGADSKQAIERIDWRHADNRDLITLAAGIDHLLQLEITSHENLFTGEVERQTTPLAIPLPADHPDGVASVLLATTTGDQLYAGWPDGTVLRWDLRDRTAPVLAERVDVVPGTASLRAMTFMNGEQSLLVGDSGGAVTAWFRVEGDDTQSTDRLHLVPAKRFTASAGPIAAFAISTRDKSFAVADERGGITLHYLTAEQRLGHVELTAGTPLVALQLGAKNDALFAVASDRSAALYEVSSPHPGITLGSVFGKTWYEGYPEPSHTWQSSSGTDDFEAKFSLIPLIFGTLKATLYAMLFAVPVAIGAAIYTSEFLDRRTRGLIKPAIEMMAALPSVVLGFVAALVLAPVVEHWVLGVVIAFVGIPTVALAFGYFWQALPPRSTLRWEGWPRTVVMVLVVLAAAVTLPRFGVVLERFLFAGDFKGWLAGTHGGAAPGLALMSWPLVIATLVLADRRWIEPHAAALQLRLGRERTALVEFAKFVGLVLLSLAGAAVVGALGASLGFDPRGSLVGTYVQRNALIVGFTMGFAVIPIIYTISEDALTAVPASLRSASLGCGATRWQTATRVVLPVAVPGIFSALMVGLGRAVGETMIVLMAAGNTPLLDLNLFNGLRTLSANIAVELPEAVKGGTLYRMLFLAALTLLVMTFVINTAAELIRLRFRKRTAAL